MYPTKSHAPRAYWRLFSWSNTGKLGRGVNGVDHLQANAKFPLALGINRRDVNRTDCLDKLFNGCGHREAHLVNASNGVF